MPGIDNAISQAKLAGFMRAFARFLLPLAVVWLGGFSGCSSLDSLKLPSFLRPSSSTQVISRSSLTAPDKLLSGMTLKVNTGSDVKTFNIEEASHGKFYDYYGNKGTFTYRYQKTGSGSGQINTMWKTSAGLSGESDVHLTFTTSSKGTLSAVEKMSDGREVAIRGRFTLRQPAPNAEEGSGVRSTPPAAVPVHVAPTPSPTPRPTPEPITPGYPH